MHNLSNLFRFLPKKLRVKQPKGCLWICKHIHTCQRNIFKLFFKKKSFKKSPLNITDGVSSGSQPSFSWKWGTGKLNQTDGQKGLLELGIYIRVTACKDLANMKKQHTGWGPVDFQCPFSSVTRRLTLSLTTR